VNFKCCECECNNEVLAFTHWQTRLQQSAPVTHGHRPTTTLLYCPHLLEPPVPPAGTCGSPLLPLIYHWPWKPDLRLLIMAMVQTWGHFCQILSVVQAAVAGSWI